MKRHAPLSLVLLAAACRLTPEPEPPYFEWCDDLLCDWTIEAGRVERAPTWHERDYGVRLLDVPVLISRGTTIDAVHCTRFSLLGYVDAEAQLALELDLLDAESIEFKQTIPETRWEAQTFLVPPVELRDDLPPPLPASLRLHKRGTGDVVLARLEVSRVACDSTDRVPIASEPDR